MSAKFRVVIVSPAAVVAEGAPEKLGDFLRQVGSAIVHKSQISVASREATQVIGVNALVITATDVKEHNGAVVVTDEEGKKFTIPADAFLRSNVSISIEALEEEEEEAPKSKKKKVADPDEEDDDFPAPKRGAAKAAGKKKKPADEEVDLDDLDI